jgi:hypothetical protein
LKLRCRTIEIKPYFYQHQFIVLRICFTIAFTTYFFISGAQTLGGNAAYNFLKLPATPLLTGTGGVNVSYKSNDAGLAANNPALLFPELSSQLNLSFNSFLANIKTYALTGAFHSEKYNTSFGGQIYFVNYGATPQTDAAGNINGEFRPVDFLVQVSAGKKYLEKWNYGASLKFISSNYGPYKSSALAVDIGLHYSDTANGFTAGLLAKNMGAQLKTYAGETEDMPFDLQIGLTKRLAKAPLGFSFTARHLHQFDILYNDTTFNNENNFSANSGFFNKVLNHFVIASHIYLGNNLEATVGYNHLRRTELNTGSGNGLNGFSFGLRAKFQKLQVLYARSQYQKNIAYNQLGITLVLNQLFGLGKDL